MSKINKYLIFFLLLTLFSSCSFGGRSGIWTGSEDEKKNAAKIEKEQKKKSEIVRIYSSKNIYSQEILATKKISLTQPKKNKSWKVIFTFFHFLAIIIPFYIRAIFLTICIRRVF